MLFHQRRQNSTRLIPGLICSSILAAAGAGCADTPNRGGIPWWPQGPGDVAQDGRLTANVAVATDAESPRSPSTPAANPHPEAVRYGDLLFVSGQVADDPSSHAIVGSDIRTQARTAMDNLKRVLEIHGLTMSNVLSVTLYLLDVAELKTVDEIYATYFPRSLPALSVVLVSGMPNGGLVEVSAIAGK